MTYFKSLVNSVESSKVSILAFAITAMVSLSAHADDIDIYKGLTGDVTEVSVTSEQKPNILFVLDTSGSMGIPEVVLNGRPNYDPTIVYGTSDTDVFVYDDNRTYTGMSFPANKNLCNAAENFHALNPQFPEYFDLALVWEYVAGDSETVETCENDTEVSFTIGSSNRNSWNTVQNYYDITPGEELGVEFSVEARGAVTFYFRDSDGDRIGQYYCDSGGNFYSWVNGGDSIDCGTVEVPANAEYLRARYWRSDSSTSTAATVSITREGECTTETIVTDASADWVVDADADAELVALECKVDSGNHGRNASSGGVFAQYRNPNYSNLTTANYVGNALNNYAVDWNATSLEERLIIPGNYHDYLQSSVADLLGSGITVLPVGDDVGAYCTTRGDNVRYGGDDGILTATYPNAGTFVEQDGLIYECQSRIGALKDATTNIISSMVGANVGVMRFNSFEGGTLVAAVADVDGSVETTDAAGNTVTTTNKSKLNTKILELPGVGATPMQETLYEAYLYFAGKTPLSLSESKTKAPDGSTVDYPTTIDIVTTNPSMTDPEAIENGKFKSPILNQCQDNNIILFSDGAATSDVSRVGLINGLTNGDRVCSDAANGDCLDDLAYALGNKDVNDDVKLDNHVYLHTIGFGSDVAGTDQLKLASNQALRPGAVGDSQHYEAVNAAELTTAFQSILLSIENVEADSFIAPAVAVNAFNRLQFRNDLYFALFEPSNTPRWNGNIKKYKITNTGDIIDSNELVAVDDSGFFHQDAKSFWSDTVDGNSVGLGGAARELDKNFPRKLFVNLDSSTTAIERLVDKQDFIQKVIVSTASDVNDLGQNGVELSSLDFGVLTAIGNLVGNSSLDPLSLSYPGEKNVNDIIEFTFGYDVDQELEGEVTDPNYYLGESLHGTPYVLDFGVETISASNTPLRNSDGELIETPGGDYIYEASSSSSSVNDDILFFTTNQGMLHAVNGDTGEELWAYIPDPDLFENLGAYYNKIIDDKHTYGLDGEIEFVVERGLTKLSESENSVTKVINTESERTLTSATMYLGQRRGGDKYFALDVAAANSPIADSTSASPVTKVWTLEGLQQMGQSWAKPVATKVQYCKSSTNCSTRDVLVISGGYDEKYDDYDPDDASASTWLEDVSGTVDGNVIYIIDRHTKQLLWTAGSDVSQVNTSYGYSIFPEMTHSFVSEPTVIDADFDGITDLMFAVDIAGRVWRFDFRGHIYTDSDDNVIIDGSDIHKGDNGSVTNGEATFNTDGTGANEVSGSIIADFTEQGANRLFYNKLDVSLSDPAEINPSQPGYNPSALARYTIVTGSGYRAQPLLDEGENDADFRNRLYFVYDRHIQFPKAIDSDEDGYPDGITYNYVALEETDGTTSLTRLEADSLPEKDNSIDLDTIRVVEVSGEDVLVRGIHYNGFYVELDTGSKEKMINPTLTNDGIVLAVSYSPTSVVTDGIGNICEKNIGSSSLYQIDLFTGEAARLDLAKAGISTKPIVIEVDNNDDPNDNSGTVKILIIGSESFDGSKDLDTNDGDIDELVTPGLNETKIGIANKINWWERRTSD